MSSISHGRDAKRYHKSFAKASKSVFTISHLNAMSHFNSHQGL